MTKLLNGFNHVATITANLDRLIEFYRDVFGAEVVMDKVAPGIDLRHVGIDLGGGAFLHAWEVSEDDVSAAGNQMFRRGRVDHVALSAPDEETLWRIEERLKARGDTDTHRSDFGNILGVFFRDPDGMELEVCCFRAGATWADARDPTGA